MNRFLATVMLCLVTMGSSALPAQAGVPSVLVQSGELPSLAPILKKVTPAVVNIVIKGPVTDSKNLPADDPMLKDLLESPPLKRFFEPQVKAAGSGVVIDAAQGLILTNHHVVDRADEIEITSPDGRRLEGRRVGSDAETDVALVRVQAENLAAIPLGDSDKLEVGDFVIAIGNPLRIGQTVTSGIVSGLRRSGLGIEQYEDFIQTDASINPGNSGGALINLRGELVGINTAIAGPGGANIGIGFAIPINMARAVADQIVKYGELRRGRLGIAVRDLTPDAAGKLSVHPGSLVAEVDEGSAAERAGLKAGDLITAVDETPVHNASDLRNKIGLLRIGDQVALRVLRDQRPTIIRATMAEGKQHQHGNSF
jgi:serine protease Do/serine protease DegQ